MNPKDRIIEIGGIELINRRRTGKFFHAYLNPGCKVEEAAFAIHGLSNDFLQDKPKFKEIARQFLEFIEGSWLVIHNAPFDVRFINNELGPLGLPYLKKNKIIDTLALARKKYPGAPASLDALCRRFRVEELKSRKKHGAILDAELLVSVYIAMRSNVQGAIQLERVGHFGCDINRCVKKKYDKREFLLSADEKEARKRLLRKINGPLWNKFSGD